MSVAADIRESLGSEAPAPAAEGWTYRVRSPKRCGLSLIGKAVMHFFRRERSLCGDWPSQPWDVYRPDSARIRGVEHCATCCARLQELPL